jgi:hypothetical protein
MVAGERLVDLYFRGCDEDGRYDMCVCVELCDYGV